ncbi:MAG: response regulator [Victivallales bacterium]|nr:response regulator [Victivallales bacterium]
METPKKTILIVDDDIDVLEQVTFMLKDSNFKLITAQSREEAEESLMTIKPDIAILDLMMEEMDAGFVLCHEIKKMYPGTPVIIHTAVTSATGISFPAASEEEKSWIGADAFLDKPIRPEQLNSHLKRLLGEKETSTH